MESIKILTVGDENVGKTSLITKYTMQSMSDEYTPTVFDTYVSCFFKDVKEAKFLEVWDTGGSKDLDRYRPLSYPDTDVVFICFSIVSPDSFKNVELRWYREVRRFCPKTPICLLGMKHDLLTDKETRDKLDKLDKSPILYFEGMELAQRIGAYKYIQCSAKTDHELQRVFHNAVYAVLRTRFLKDDIFWEDHEDCKCTNIF